MAITRTTARKCTEDLLAKHKKKAEEEDVEQAEDTNEDGDEKTTKTTTKTTTTTTTSKTRKGTKRALEKKEKEEEEEADEDEDEGESSDKKVKTEFSCDEPAKSDGQLKIISWNVAGFNACVKKGFKDYLEKEKADVFCLQESKIKEASIPKDQIPEGYSYTFIHCIAKPGHHGTAVIYKNSLRSGDYPKITTGINIEKHDGEGRVITMEFEKFYLINSYIPNSGTRGLLRLDYRIKEWDVDFQNYLKKLDKSKPIVWTGDLNVAHQEIDLKNPKTNQRSAGFTKEERESFGNFLKEGFIDSYRHYNPDKTGVYTFWSHMRNARATNAGWRLDYFVVSKRFINSIKSPFVRSAVLGSDHCPLGIIIDLNESLIE